MVRADIRCVNVGPPESLAPFRLFARTLGYCLLGELEVGFVFCSASSSCTPTETLSLHACIALACAIFLTLSRRPSSTPA